MSNDAAENDLAHKVKATCDYYQTDGQRPHLVWYYDTLMSRLAMSDLSTQELAAVVSVLIGAHTRKLAAAHGPESPGGVFVEVVRSTVPKRPLRAVG